MCGGSTDLQAERRLAGFLLHLVREESCGECLPCTLGIRQIMAVLDRAAGGGENAGTVETVLLREVGRTMRQAAKCGVGRIGGALVEELLDRFPAFFEPGA